MMNGVEPRIELPWTSQNYEITHSQIIRGAAFICKHATDSLEILDILGIKDDLQKLRVCRRIAKNGTSSKMQGS